MIPPLSLTGRDLHTFAHELRWDEWSHATIRGGDHDVAAEIARRADELDDLADLVDAQGWAPAVKLPRLSPADRDQLGCIFDRVVAERSRDELAERARRARATNLPRDRRYVEAALEREAETVRAAPVGLRNTTLAQSAWSLARFACDGELAEGDVLGALVPAAMSTGLCSREAHACVRAALRRRCAA